MKTLKTTALLLALLAVLGLLTGCESDTVAPHDELPPIDDGDAATQAGAVAFALTNVAPYMINPTTVSKELRTIDFAGDHGLTGTVAIDFRTGPDGPDAAADVATWAHLYTDPSVVWETPLGGQTAFSFDITATLDQAAETATILAGSNGSLVSGDYETSFVIDGVVVGGGAAYPTAGTLTVTAGDHVAVVNFNGSSVVMVIVDSMTTYLVDLDTGAVDELVPV